jgi:hypothetical protein
MMSQLKIKLTISALLLLVGCGEAKSPSTQTPKTSPPPVTTTTPQTTNSSPVESPTVATSPSSNTPQGTTAVAPNSTAPNQTKLISAEGIGEAKVGMTFGELKKRLGTKAQFQVKSPFIVDFDAIAIVQSGQAQYYILYPAGVPLSDSDIIEALVTDNPNYRTAQGVGSGTPITQAEAVYGEATLSYSTVNESREYVKFAKDPSEAIAFRVAAPKGQQFAGNYPSSTAELKETKDFQKPASIGFVEIYCRQNCPLPSPNE